MQRFGVTNTAIAALTTVAVLSTMRNAPHANAQDAAAFRPPAVPLVTFDPYLSVWSGADKLTDATTRHWTQREQPLSSLIRVDGETFRLMGTQPEAVPALPQTALQVLPTRSIYQFENTKIHVTLTFMTAALPRDLEVLARPLTYVTWDVRATDGKNHVVSLFDGTSALLSVNAPQQPVQWSREKMGDLTALRAGTVEQSVLGASGDDTRIDWGYIYAVAGAKDSAAAIGSSASLLQSFVQSGKLPFADDTKMPRAANEDAPMLGHALYLGNVGPNAVSRHVMIGYDEIYAIKYFGIKLRPYWRRNGTTPAQMFAAAERDYPDLQKRCAAFDTELVADATRAGGAKYADMCALAYRQTLSANGLAVDANNQPLYFTKENSSNGDIATVDVFFPMAPQLLLTSPSLMKASLVSNLEYAASPHWKFPNAPHDLGTYPIVTGRDDGGEGMPVEESGNMLILCDAISQIEGNGKFVSKWWPTLTRWEQYLEKYGSDPEEQLSTNDFMGHLAHNANLSVKAILGIAAYGDMARLRGDTATADRLQKMARGFAEHWVQVADAGDHSLLAFDKPNTWSQKYNLVWDKLLGLKIFPVKVAQQEVAYYQSMMQPFGVPLDSRTKLSKTDWTLWSATMADNKVDFQKMIAPVYSYLNQTTARLPFVDSYVTNNVKSDGMRARPVIGGVFIKMLDDRAMWLKWAKRGDVPVGPWAPLPKPPIVTPVVATGQKETVMWRYTTEKPADNWTQPDFDAAAWKEGAAGFGGAPGLTSHTPWNTPDIWIRREFVMPDGNYPNLQFNLYHDEDVELYINGVPAAKEGGFVSSYTPLEMNAAARALLKPGAKITLAAHVHQTAGGQGVDIGLANVVPARP